MDTIRSKPGARRAASILAPPDAAFKHETATFEANAREGFEHK